MKGRKKSKEWVYNLEDQQEFIEKISSKIRRLRQEAGYSSHETFAFEHGIDRTQWSKMERGIDMKISTLHKALAALDITPAEFFKDFK
jgi:transcriptional regulator with XRE-family HTH domain